MCFGLRNAAQTFQRHIENIIRGLDGCYAYLDDILVASTDQNSHKQELSRLFERLSDHEIRINVD